MTFPVFASGDVLNASDMNAVGLWLVKTQTIGTTVSSVTVTDAFSSTYDNYLIIVGGGVGSATERLKLTLGATATGYYYGGTLVSYASATVNGLNAANDTSFDYCAHMTSNSLDGYIVLRGPNLARVTGITAHGARLKTGEDAYQYSGFLNNSTQYTAFTFTTSAGTMTGGTIRVYGYRN